MLVKEKTAINYLLEKESFFWTPDYLEISAWIEHIPFAFWIIEVLKPKVTVELGVHNGTSYFSFCQAVKVLNIDATCYGVDTWKGDEHSGFYEEEVFGKVTEHNKQEYSRFSTLIRSTFDEAKDYFIDGSVELLHIDGLHTYEAVKHDFENWLPKLTPDAIVVFHDINVRERNFGVFKLWEELKQQYRHFQFDFGHGLGILAIGEVTGEIRVLLNENKVDEYYIFLRNLFSDRGSSFKTKFDTSLSLLQERESLKMQRNTLSQVTDSHRILESNNSQLQESKTELAANNELLNERYKTLELNNELLNEKYKTLELNNELLNERYKTLELNNNELDKSYRKLVESNEKLKENYRTLELNNEKYQSSVTKLSDKLNTTSSSLNHITKELSDQKNTIKELNTLSQKQSQIIQWYKDTYEDRNIIGVLKEKIKSSLKKKIKSDIPGHNTSSKISGNNPLKDDGMLIEKTRKHIYALIPVNELQKLDEAGEYSSTGTLKIKYQVDSPILSDVCLFSSFSFSGKVEEYVYHYLSELQKAGLSIVFISTSPLTESCVSRLSQYAFIIIERENKCPDFGSWKAGLSMLNWGKGLNSVLLVNDSIFGPFFDLDNIISSMKNRYDVWGMTDSYEIEYHLQSYFLYFNKATIASEVFTKFWKNVDLSASKDEVIHKYEIGLSNLFIRSNFNLGAYARIDSISKSAVHGHKIVNPLLVFWKSLIKTHQFPFLKRELIIKKNISRTYDDHRDLYINVGSWKKTIEENSSYPISYIVEFMNNYYKSIKAINSSIVLRKRKILFLTNNAEIGGAQMLLINFLRWLKNETDIDVEIIICKEGNNDLATEFAKLGIVTNFYALSQAEKKNLKGRLIDEVALIFSNTIENLNTQKFLSFLDVPQIIFVHEMISTNILSVDNNMKWIKDNVSQFIASTDIVRQNIVEYFGVDDKKIELVYKFDNFTTAVQAPKIMQIINTYYDHEELRFTEDPLVTLMIHIYYENSWDEIRNKLRNYDNGKNYFLFSISEACLIREQIIEDIKKSFKNAFSLITSNIGKDIGGKMALIDLYLLLDIKSSYIVFLHDKQSPHSLGGESWKKELFKIIDPNNQNLILELFKDPKTGMVGAKDHIVNEFNNNTDTFRNNNQLSKKLLIQFGISIENYDFLGGSMYWLRSSIIEKFFAKNNPILMRENLEAGNVLDLHGETLAHTWERMFSWIATNEGYSIKGI